MRDDPAANQVLIQRPRPHPGQRRIIAAAGRFNVVRCGRRFGKSTIGILETIDALLRGEPVGWFSARYDLFMLAWEELLWRLQPLIISKQENNKTFKLITGGTFKGWSLDSDDPGRSAHYALIIIDEAGLVPRLGSLWRTSIRPTMLDHENSRAWILGTPKVSGPAFNELFNRGARNEGGWRCFKGRTAENPHLPGILEELEQARLEMPEWEYLQEYEGEPAESDTGFFPAAAIERHRLEHGRRPIARGTIGCPGVPHYDLEAVVIGKKVDRIAWSEDPRGGWRTWLPFDEDDRPDQDASYVMGVDLSYGVGASNTVISVAQAETRTKVAEFVSPAVTPEEAASIAALAGLWLGGRTGMAVINFESNGPGEVFAKQLRRLRYRAIYRARPLASHTDSGSLDRLGWRSGATAKELLLGDYRAALCSDRFINPCEPALTECLTYRVDEKGRVVSQYEWAEDHGEAARVPHGDRVIADALCWLACQYVTLRPPVVGPPPKGSAAWRREEFERKRRRDPRSRNAAPRPDIFGRKPRWL